jgi:hypothetical protein
MGHPSALSAARSETVDPPPLPLGPPVSKTTTSEAAQSISPLTLPAPKSTKEASEAGPQRRRRCMWWAAATAGGVVALLVADDDARAAAARRDHDRTTSEL